MKYYRKLVGDKVYLSPVNLEDSDKYTEWINDLEIAVNLGSAAEVFNQEKEKEYIDLDTATQEEINQHRIK